MDNTAYLKALNKKKEAQGKALKRKRQQQECPIYQNKILAKKKVSQDKAIAKQKLKQNQELSEAQKNKRRESFERSKLKQRESVKRSQVKQRENAKLKLANPLIIRSIKEPVTNKVARTPKKVKPKERPRTKADKELHDRMAALGCIACRNKALGLEDMDSTNINYVSIHHVDGRVKLFCHLFCLPLCQWHHDCPMNAQEALKYALVFPIHAKGRTGGKNSWEKVNGKQVDLIKQVWDLIGYLPEHEVTEKLNQLS